MRASAAGALRRIPETISGHHGVRRTPVADCNSE
jgi:hypothetical protein